MNGTAVVIRDTLTQPSSLNDNGAVAFHGNAATVLGSASFEVDPAHSHVRVAFDRQQRATVVPVEDGTLSARDGNRFVAADRYCFIKHDG